MCHMIFSKWKDNNEIPTNLAQLVPVTNTTYAACACDLLLSFGCVDSVDTGWLKESHTCLIIIRRAVRAIYATVHYPREEGVLIVLRTPSFRLPYMSSEVFLMHQ